MSTVLLVGEDRLLLDTRAAVIRTIGVETLCCHAASALEVLADTQCEVVILCHSLPERLAAVLAEVIHKRWPRTRVLAVSSARMWEQFDARGAVDAVSSADPERLVLNTIQLLGRRGPATVQLNNRCIAVRQNAMLH
jgi:DNA-binding NarL/FixJ family response regulator